MRRWKCGVCGYIHEGDEPPEKCPVCGADRSRFVELIEEADPPIGPVDAPEPEPAVSPYLEKLKRFPLLDRLTEQMVDFHAHPISVHIPNGVLPLSVLFLLISAFFRLDGPATAAFYNMIFVLLAMPFVLFSGFNDWQRRFGGSLTPVFIGKMVCGGIVLLLSLFLVIWWILDPSVASAGSGSRSLFLFLHVVLLAAAVVAGYLGGKLVFNRK